MYNNNYYNKNLILDDNSFFYISKEDSHLFKFVAEKILFVSSISLKIFMFSFFQKSNRFELMNDIKSFKSKVTYCTEDYV